MLTRLVSIQNRSILKRWKPSSPCQAWRLSCCPLHAPEYQLPLRRKPLKKRLRLLRNRNRRTSLRGNTARLPSLQQNPNRNRNRRSRARKLSRATNPNPYPLSPPRLLNLFQLTNRPAFLKSLQRPQNNLCPWVKNRRHGLRL